MDPVMAECKSGYTKRFSNPLVVSAYTNAIGLMIFIT